MLIMSSAFFLGFPSSWTESLGTATKLELALIVITHCNPPCLAGRKMPPVSVVRVNILSRDYHLGSERLLNRRFVVQRLTRFPVRQERELPHRK